MCSIEARSFAVVYVYMYMYMFQSNISLSLSSMMESIELCENLPNFQSILCISQQDFE